MADTINISANADQAIAEINKLITKVDSLQSTFKDKFDKMGGHVLALAAAFTAATGAVAAFADDISDVAAANQVAIEQVLGLSKALEGSGGKAENVGKMFQAMSNNIEEANNGNLKTVTTFNRLGVSINDLGNLSNTALKDKLLSGLVAIKDPIERNALAMQVFGKSLVGVDIEKFANDQKKLTAEMAPFAASIETAGNAWDSMVAAVGNLKIAFAEAFQPFFLLISKIYVPIDAAVVGFRLLAIGVAAVVAPSIIAGFGALIAAVKTLTLVAARNPFIAIATALLALGPTIAKYTGLLSDVEDQQGKNNDATNTGKRNQEGLNDAIQKEKDKLSEAGKELTKNFATLNKKYDLQLKGLSQSESEKTISEEINKIDQMGIDAKDKAQKAFDSLSKSSQSARKADFEQELKDIDTKTEKEKAAAATRLKYTQEYTDMLKKFQGIQTTLGDADAKIFNDQSKAAIARMGSLYDQIDAEGKLAALTKIRTDMLANVKSLPETDQAGAINAINSAINNVDLLSVSYEDLSVAVKQAIQDEVTLGTVSEEGAKKLQKGLDVGTIIQAQERLSASTKSITSQSRSFSDGWSQAFSKYVKDATDASAIATRLFTKFTQGLEDALVNFVKTGKFEWKNFVGDMAEELLRSSIKQTIAGLGSAFGLGDLFGGGGGGQRGGSPNSPMYVYDVAGGGGAGGLLSGGGIGGGSSPFGGIIDTAKSIFGGVVDTATSVFSGIGDAIGGIFSGGGSGGGGGGGDFLSSIGDFFGGFFANGGQLGAGKWGVAGENGPELISGPANVSPMGGSTNITYNINAVDSMSFKQMIAADPSFLYAVTQQGAMGTPRRY